MSRTTSRRTAAVAGLSFAALSAGVLFASPAMAADRPAPLIDPTAVAEGNSEFTISGEGCLDTDKPGHGDGIAPSVMVTVGDIVIDGVLEPAEDGTWGDIILLENFPAGTYDVVATCDNYYGDKDAAYPTVTLTVGTPAPPATAAPTTTAAPTPGLAAASEFSLTVKGFQPNEKVKVVIYSEPVELGTFTANRDGVVTIKATLPAGFQVGSHELKLTGDKGTVKTIALTVAADGSVVPVKTTDSPVLAYTGSDTALPLTLGAGLLLAGGGALVVSRRRRTAGATQA